MKILTDLIVTTFYIGKLPFAPGTWASFFATLSWLYFFDSANSYLVPILSIALFAVGTYFSDISLKKSNDHDPSYIVIDEWVGQWIALWLIPHSFYWGFASFVLFRFFDISKLGPVQGMDDIKSGTGIMMDDVVAGILALLVTQSLYYFVG